MSAPTTKRVAPAELSRTGLDAWHSFLVAHSRLTQELDHEMRERHAVSLGDFDVLVQLAEAPRGRLRMCELASAVLLSPSGLSRRIDRLESAGVVKRERACEDARNVEARLTPAGKRLFRRLRETHRGGVKDRIEDRLDPDELETLSELLGRLARPGEPARG